MPDYHSGVGERLVSSIIMVPRSWRWCNPEEEGTLWGCLGRFEVYRMLTNGGAFLRFMIQAIPSVCRCFWSGRLQLEACISKQISKWNEHELFA